MSASMIDSHAGGHNLLSLVAHSSVSHIACALAPLAHHCHRTSLLGPRSRPQELALCVMSWAEFSAAPLML